MENTESCKKLEAVQEGGIQSSIHQTGHDTDGKDSGRGLEETVGRQKEGSRGKRRAVHLDNTKGKTYQPAENGAQQAVKSSIKNNTGFKCMYTNVDTITNKMDELNARIADTDPDIVGLKSNQRMHPGIYYHKRLILMVIQHFLTYLAEA